MEDADSVSLKFIEVNISRDENAEFLKMYTGNSWYSRDQKCRNFDIIK